MNERIDRVLKKMEDKGLSQLLVSDPLSIRFLTGIMVNPGEIVRTASESKRKTYFILKLPVLCIKHRI